MFYKPSCQLGAGIAPGSTAIPVLLEWANDNDFFGMRHEGNSGPVAQLENTVTGNNFDVGADVANVAATTLLDNTTPEGGDRPLANFVRTWISPNSTGRSANKYLTPIWHSGNLTERITYVDGGTKIHIPGICHIYTSVAIVSLYPKWLSSGAPQVITPYYTPNASDGIGIFLDTTTAKKFVMRRDVESGFGGRVRFSPFGSDGNILADDPSPPHVIQRDMTWSAAGFGGTYAQTSDIPDDIYFEVDSNTKKVLITISGGTAALRIRSFSLYIVDAVVPHGAHAMAYPGYEEVIPGARLIDGTVPTAGTYERGAILFDKLASASTAAGQVCSSSGTFSSATDATGDTTSGSATIAGMTDTSDFNVGDFVTVSAGFGTNSPLGETIFKILDIQSATITLDTASDSTQSNVTVATVSPVFKAMASHGA